MAIAARLDSAGVLVMFGAFQIPTGLRNRMPMPVQPLKAMAALVIAHGITGPVLAGGALSVGVLMLLLSVTGLVDWVAGIVPKPVARGIQFGLGWQLATLALGRHVAGSGTAGYGLAVVGLLIVITLVGNRRHPAALVVVALGVVYATAFTLDGQALWRGVGCRRRRFPAGKTFPPDSSYSLCHNCRSRSGTRFSPRASSRWISFPTGRRVSESSVSLTRP